jgi:hypothetical protein
MFRDDVARGPVPRWRVIVGIWWRGWSILGCFADARASQAVAGEIDPVRVVDDAIEDGVSVGGNDLVRLDRVAALAMRALGIKSAPAKPKQGLGELLRSEQERATS